MSLILNLWKKALKDSSYYLIANLGARFVGFLSLPLVARILSVKEFGKYDIFLLVSSFLSLFFTLGIDSGIAVFIAENRENDRILSVLYTFQQVVTLLLFLLLSGAILLIYYLFQVPSFLSDYPIDFCLKIIIYAFIITVVYNSFNFLRYLERPQIASIVNFLSSCVGVILGLIFLFLSSEKKVDYFINGIILGSILSVLITVIFTKDYINPKFWKERKKLFKEILWVSVPFLPNYLSDRFMQMVDRIVILKLFSLTELG